MKNILLVLGFIFSLNTFSQNSTVKTETFVVKGNCDQCKKRIENAADIKGVKISNWDEKMQIISVTYNPEKVTIEQIQKAIAKSGHDAGIEKSPDKAYKKLPECCKYHDRACEKK